MDYLGIFSPKGNELMPSDGNADSIDTRGEYLRELGVSMETTADSLQKIGEGTTQISEAVDKVRESASKIHGELSQAATRYSGTGEALIAYADVLRAATRNMDPLIEEIQAAQTSVSTAAETQSDAQRAVSDNNTTWIWEEETTDAEKAAAQSDLDDAESTLSTARSTLDGLWAEYDAHFAIWEEGYDDAVNGIDSAITEADNNDGWFADLMKVLNKICFVLAVVAIFVSGPIAGVILVVTTVVAVVQLSRDIYAVTQGEGSMLDVAVGAVGLVPFAGGFARVAGRGVRGGYRAVVNGGDNVLGGFRAAGRGTTRGTTQELTGMWRNATAGPRSLPTRNPVTGVDDQLTRVPVAPTAMNNARNYAYNFVPHRGMSFSENTLTTVSSAATMYGTAQSVDNNIVQPLINPAYNEANARY